MFVLLGISIGLVSMAADFNGDGRDDIAVYRPAEGLWAIRNLTRVYFGSSLDEPAAGDYNGDGTAETVLWRPSTGMWAIRGVTRAYFGVSSDLPGGASSNPWAPTVGGILYAGGNVGIWATDTGPLVELDIYDNGGDGTPRIRLTGEDVGWDESVIEFWNAWMPGMSIGYYPKEMAMKIRDDGTNEDLVVIGEGPAEGATMSVLCGNMKVGFDDPLPSEQLAVKMAGTTWSDHHFALVASASDDTWDFTVGTNNRLYVGYNEVSKFVMQTSGNVGIGNTNPAYLLAMESSGGGYYSATDHSWHNGSSRTIKDDIRPNEVDVLKMLDEVKIVNYRFKSEGATEGSAPGHIGFIAEEAPDLLTGKDKNSMATGDCIGFLLAVVKEQQNTISSLEGKVASLEERLK
jgi:hypothetical protein